MEGTDMWIRSRKYKEGTISYIDGEATLSVYRHRSRLSGWGM